MLACVYMPAFLLGENKCIGKIDYTAVHIVASNHTGDELCQVTT